jgi:hypothetical protein
VLNAGLQKAKSPGRDSLGLGKLQPRDGGYSDLGEECLHLANYAGKQPLLWANNQESQGRRKHKMMKDAVKATADQCPSIEVMPGLLNFFNRKQFDQRVKVGTRGSRCPRREARSLFFWRPKKHQENRWQFQPYCAILVLNIFR